jgi:hypothetical protein
MNLRLLLLPLALLLMAGAPTSVGPKPVVQTAGRNRPPDNPVVVNPVRNVTVECDPDEGDAPFSCQATIEIEHNGELGQFVPALDCGNDQDPLEPPSSFGTAVTPNLRSYTYGGVCTYVTEDIYTITATVKNAVTGDTLDSDTTTVDVTEPPGQVQILAVSVSEDPSTIPCNDMTLRGYVYNLDGTPHWKVDEDNSCASSTTSCSDACWTEVGTTRLIDADLPDDSIAGVGLQTLRVCVEDDSSEAFTQLLFETQSATANLACTTTAGSSASSPYNNFALQVNCSGGTSAQGCDLDFDCNVDLPGAGESVHYTNGFDTTGVAGCDDITSTQGTASCSGGTASAGSGSSGTNALFFHSQYANVDDQTIHFDDFTVVTDSPTSAGSNKNRINLRDSATSKYVFQTANSTSNTGRLTCPGSSCTTPAAMYTDGVPFDFGIHVNTATGTAELLDSSDNVLCTCSGNAAANVNGFVVNGDNAVITLSGFEVTVPSGSTDPARVVANTTWPYSTQTATGENCDGYTTGTSTARVTVSCPDSESLPLDIPVQVGEAAPFLITSITPDIGTGCTVPNCIVNEVSMAYSGGSGTVSDIACTMKAGSTAEVFATTTDAASPFTFTAEGGWAAGYDYDTDGTYEITCSAVRSGVTATKTVQVKVDPEVTAIVDLVAEPLLTSRTSTPGGVPTSDEVCLKSSDDSAVAFTCTETDPDSIVAYSATSGTTPQCLTRTYNGVASKTSGLYRGILTCTRTANTLDTAVSQVEVFVSDPTPPGNDPVYIVGRDSSNRPLMRNADGTIRTIHNVDHRATPTMVNKLGAAMKQYDEGFSDSYSENALIYNSTFDRKNGNPSSVDCVPLSECATLPDSESDPDAVHIWQGIKYNSLSVIGNWFKNSIFRNTTCTNSKSCPHADLLQAYMADDCPGAHTSFINNVFGADATKGEEQGDGGSDSGQQAHMTKWGDPGNSTCNVKTVLIQGNVAVQDPGAGCTARGVGTYTGTRACGKLHFQAPAIASAGKAFSVWCGGNSGITLKAGATSAGDQILPAERIVKFGPASGCPTTQIIGSPTIVTYPDMEAAIAGESALGNDIPPDALVSCAARRDQTNCLSTVGDADWPN